MELEGLELLGILEVLGTPGLVGVSDEVMDDSVPATFGEGFFFGFSTVIQNIGGTPLIAVDTVENLSGIPLQCAGCFFSVLS